MKKQTEINFSKINKEQTTKLITQVLGLIPQIHVSAPPSLEWGGKTLAQIGEVVASSFGVKATILRNKASMSATYAGYDRRQEDWNLSIKTAKEELNRKIMIERIKNPDVGELIVGVTDHLGIHSEVDSQRS